MRLVDKQQKILVKIVEQGMRSRPRRPSFQHAGIVLDAFAETDLLQHLHIIFGPLFNPLCFQQLALRLEHPNLVFHLGLDVLNRGHQLFPRGDKMGRRVDRNMGYHPTHITGQRVDFAQPVDFVPPEFHADRRFTAARRKDLDGIAAYPELGTGKGNVVAVVLQLNQPVEQLVTRQFHTGPQ